ncbi:hypothetical protein GQ42DRAFT_31297 [Ramicandelaber brevisporus]|nr:hypothetical protein GQ42DRAFT_31297 [Ramicandelaber brevisporus]
MFVSFRSVYSRLCTLLIGIVLSTSMFVSAQTVSLGTTVLYTNDYPLLAQVSGDFAQTDGNLGFAVSNHCTGVIIDDKYVLTTGECYPEKGSNEPGKHSTNSVRVIVDIGTSKDDKQEVKYTSTANRTLTSGVTDSQGAFTKGSLIIMTLNQTISSPVVTTPLKTLKFADIDTIKDNQVLSRVIRTDYDSDFRFNVSNAIVVPDQECMNLLKEKSIPGASARKEGAYMCTKSELVGPCDNSTTKFTMLTQPLDGNNSADSKSKTYTIAGIGFGGVCDGQYDYNLWIQPMKFVDSIASYTNVDKTIYMPESMIKSTGLSTGAIVGIAVGGAAVLVLLVVAAVYIRRYRRENHKLAVDQAAAIKDLGEQLARVEQPTTTSGYDYYDTYDAPVYYVPITSATGEVIAYQTYTGENAQAVTIDDDSDLIFKPAINPNPVPVPSPSTTALRF